MSAFDKKGFAMVLRSRRITWVKQQGGVGHVKQGCPRRARRNQAPTARSRQRGADWRQITHVRAPQRSLAMCRRFKAQRMRLPSSSTAMRHRLCEHHDVDLKRCRTLSKHVPCGFARCVLISPEDGSNNRRRITRVATQNTEYCQLSFFFRGLLLLICQRKAWAPTTCQSRIGKVVRRAFKSRKNAKNFESRQAF